MRLLHRMHNYLRSYVRIELRGTSPERFLNLCAQEGVDFWDAQFRDENCIRVTLRAGSYLSAAPLVRRCACRVRIISRGGAHYGLRAAFGRPVLIVSAALLACLCVLIDSMALSFDFTGYETVTPRALMQAMEKNGLYAGVWKKNIDASDLRDRMLSDIPELIWFTVTFHGSRAGVDVRERVPVPETVRADIPAQIVSDYHAVVRDVSVYSGRAAVKAGDTVEPGTVLVSSQVDLRLDGRTLTVHARADILADVWYKSTLVYPLRSAGKIRTGRKKTRWALVVGKRRVDFYKNDGKVFDNYDKILTKYGVSFPGFSLPALLVRETFFEYETFSLDCDTENASLQLVGLAKRAVLSRDTGVTISRASSREDGELLFAYAYGSCRRYIGRTEQMP